MDHVYLSLKREGDLVCANRLLDTLNANDGEDAVCDQDCPRCQNPSCAAATECSSTVFSNAIQ